MEDTICFEIEDVVQADDGSLVVVLSLVEEDEE